MLLYKVLAFALFCLTLRMGIIKDRDYFSPYTLFATSPFCVLIYSNYLSNVFLPLPGHLAMFTILLGQTSFILGLTLFRYNSEVCCQTLHNKPLVLEPGIRYSYITLFLLGLSPFVMALLLNPFGTSLSAEGVADFRAKFSLPIVSALSCLMTGALLCAARDKNLKVFMIMAAIVLISGSLTQSRAGVVVLFMVILYTVVHYWQRRYLKAVFVSGLFVIAGMFFLYVLVRQGALHNKSIKSNYSHYYESARCAKLPRLCQPFYGTYMYMTAPLSNFAYLIEEVDDRTYGKLMLWPIISTFQFKRIANIEKTEKPIRIWPYNTHTFMGDYYMDFGINSLIVLSALTGMIVYCIYWRSLKSNDCLIHAEYLYFGLATLLMFFNNHFTSSAYPLRVFIICEIYRNISISKRLSLYSK